MSKTSFAIYWTIRDTDRRSLRRHFLLFPCFAAVRKAQPAPGLRAALAKMAEI